MLQCFEMNLALPLGVVVPVDWTEEGAVENLTARSQYAADFLRHKSELETING